MSCNCPTCCVKQATCCPADPCSACCSSGDNECSDCDYVKARLTIAWLAETPDCQCPRTCGYQLEFCEKPCCVKKIIKQLTDWLNCPPVDEEDDCSPCPPQPCGPCPPPNCNPCPPPSCRPCPPPCKPRPCSPCKPRPCSPCPPCKPPRSCSPCPPKPCCYKPPPCSPCPPPPNCRHCPTCSCCPKPCPPPPCSRKPCCRTRPKVKKTPTNSVLFCASNDPCPPCSPCPKPKCRPKRCS